MRCSKSCYLRDLELVDLFDNRVIEQVYLFCSPYAARTALPYIDDGRVSPIDQTA